MLQQKQEVKLNGHSPFSPSLPFGFIHAFDRLAPIKCGGPVSALFIFMRTASLTIFNGLSFPNSLHNSVLYHQMRSGEVNEKDRSKTFIK